MGKLLTIVSKDVHRSCGLAIVLLISRTEMGGYYHNAVEPGKQGCSLPTTLGLCKSNP